MPFDVATPTFEERDRRLSRRLPAKDGAKVEVRTGALGLGPDLALGLVDVSEQGACVRVKSRLVRGAEVEVKLTGVGRGKAVAGPATVCWCRAAEGCHLVGLKLSRRLAYRELLDFVKQRG
jgi:hypothetical protein